MAQLEENEHEHDWVFAPKKDITFEEFIEVFSNFDVRCNEATITSISEGASRHFKRAGKRLDPEDLQ